jgi:hypothetical protein
LVRMHAFYPIHYLYVVQVLLRFPFRYIIQRMFCPEVRFIVMLDKESYVSSYMVL